MSKPQASDVRVKAVSSSGWPQLTAVAIAVWDRGTHQGYLNPQYLNAAKVYGAPANNVYTNEAHLLNMVASVDQGKPIQYLQNTGSTIQLIFTGQDAQITELLTGH